MTGFDFIDKYTIKARVFPAVIAFAPALALAVLYISWDSFSLSDAFVALASVIFLVVLADIARRSGKRIEKQLLKSWGGMPSTHLLRHRDATLNDHTKSRYLKFLAEKIGEDAPTLEDEEENPQSCDEFYGRCCLWLREHTRDRELFGILLEENMNYGFRRNLLGLKNVALAMSALVAVVCVISFVCGVSIIAAEGAALEMVLIAGFSGIHIAYFAMCVTKNSVYDAALLYARQLILSCEKLIAGSD